MESNEHGIAPLEIPRLTVDAAVELRRVGISVRPVIYDWSESSTNAD